MSTSMSGQGRILKHHPNEKPSILKKVEKVVREQQSRGNEHGNAQKFNHTKKK